MKEGMDFQEADSGISLLRTIPDPPPCKRQYSEMRIPSGSSNGS
jgi:hypothetical protein